MILDTKKRFVTLSLQDAIELLQSMHYIISSINDEEAYERWIYMVPDGATKEDFRDIATDQELFDDTVDLFHAIIKEYLK